MAAKKKTDETIKAGKSTSELWITAVIQIVQILIAAYGAHKGNDALVAIGGGGSALSGAAYTIGRSIVKSKAAPGV